MRLRDFRRRCRHVRVVLIDCCFDRNKIGEIKREEIRLLACYYLQLLNSLLGLLGISRRDVDLCIVREESLDCLFPETCIIILCAAEQEGRRADVNTNLPAFPPVTITTFPVKSGIWSTDHVALGIKAATFWSRNDGMLPMMVQGSYNTW